MSNLAYILLSSDEKVEIKNFNKLPETDQIFLLTITGKIVLPYKKTEHNSDRIIIDMLRLGLVDQIGVGFSLLEKGEEVIKRITATCLCCVKTKMIQEFTCLTQNYDGEVECLECAQENKVEDQADMRTDVGFVVQPVLGQLVPSPKTPLSPLL